MIYVQNDLCFRPGAINAFDEHSVLSYSPVHRDIVRRTCIIGIDVDNDDVRSWLLRKVPHFWIISPDINCRSLGSNAWNHW
jgi:hypothetical protein